jgi:hypothetical protein
MKCDSRASLLACTFQAFALVTSPKLGLRQCLLLNGDILFVQGYSCKKENMHFNPKDSTMEPRLFQNMQIAATSTPISY